MSHARTGALAGGLIGEKGLDELLTALRNGFYRFGDFYWIREWRLTIRLSSHVEFLKFSLLYLSSGIVLEPSVDVRELPDSNIKY